MKRLAKIIGLGLAGLIALLVVVGIIGALLGIDDETDEPEAAAGQPTVDVPAALATIAEATANHQPPPTATPFVIPTPRPPEYDLVLVSANCTSMADIGFVECQGFVRNARPYALENVTAVIILHDATGTPFASNEALIDYNPILADQQSPYTVILNYNPAFTTWTVEFMELLGGTLRTDYSQWQR